MKNLVLVHLESISNTFLWQYRTELSTVWELMQGSCVYSNFHASATSTGMSVSDVFIGAYGYFDALTKFGKPRSSPLLGGIQTLNTHLYLDYRYSYLNYALDYLGEPVTNTPSPRMVKYTGTDEPGLMNHLRGQLTNITAAKRRFMIFFRNNISHMALDNRDTFNKGLPERFSRSYRALDHSIKALFDLLKEAGVWENCIVVCYGDHGDELWSHEVNKGYCHCIAPYATQTWTPFFIYESGVEPKVNPNLVSMLDVKATILNRMFPGYIPKHPKLLPLETGRFSGMDAEAGMRKSAIAQNLFVLQQEYSDPERGLKKGYAITDGNYRVVVHSGGEERRDGGMEFFYDRIDPYNVHNLLQYFVINSQGNIVARNKLSDTANPVIGKILAHDRADRLAKKFNELRSILHDTVRQREKESLKYVGGDYHVMPERSFERMKKNSLDRALRKVR